MNHRLKTLYSFILKEHLKLKSRYIGKGVYYVEGKRGRTSRFGDLLGAPKEKVLCDCKKCGSSKVCYYRLVGKMNSGWVSCFNCGNHSGDLKTRMAAVRRWNRDNR